MARVILPLMTISVARIYAWRIILGRKGIIKDWLLAEGLVNEPQRLIFTENSLIIGVLQLFWPLMVLPLVSALENVPDDVVEAARSRGANGFTIFRRVILPLSAAGLELGGTLVFTGAITGYVTPAIVGGNRVLVLATLMQQRATVAMDWSGATVVALAV